MGQVRFWVSSTNLGGGEGGEGAIFQLYVCLKNGFRMLTFEIVSVLDTYSVHRYIIIRYLSSSNKEKNHQLLKGLLPFFHFIILKMLEKLRGLD